MGLTSGLAVRLLLVALLSVTAAYAQGVDLVVTFNRATSLFDAERAVRQIDPSAETDGTFEPVRVTRHMDSPLTTDQVEALYENGAISVELVARAAQLAASGVTLEPPAGLERVTEPPVYLLRVTYPSTMPSHVAAAHFEAAAGVPPGGVDVRANELRVRVSSRAVASRLRTTPGVLAVRDAAP